MLRPHRPSALRALSLLPFTALLAGCGLLGSSDNGEKGDLSVEVIAELVNFHSAAFGWTATFTDTVTLRYRLLVAESETTRTEYVPVGARFDVDRSSSGMILPMSGFEPSKTYWVWVVAYREDPAFRIIKESAHVTFTTCASPYGMLTKTPRPLVGMRAAVLDDKVYIVWPDGVVERFGPIAKTWTTLPPVPSPHSDFGIAVVGGRLYVLGGANSSVIDVFNSTTNVWEAPIPIPQGISIRTAAVLGDTIYTFPASDQLGPSRAWSEYPTGRQMTAYIPGTNTWLARADRPGFEVMGPTMGYLGKLYLFGSYTAGTTDYTFMRLTLSDSIYVYSPVRDQWSALQTAGTFPNVLPDKRVGFHATVSYGRLYLLGGLLSKPDTTQGGADIWSVPPGLGFDGTTQPWSLKTVPAAPLDFGEHGAAVAVGPTIYFVNGGHRWPATLGTYVPDNDNCGFDLQEWADIIPYGIPYTATSRIAQGELGLRMREPRAWARR